MAIIAERIEAHQSAALWVELPQEKSLQLF
jgi:hypothetical protein